MRWPISLASASISCMVRLLAMPPNTVCGTCTPTVAQTSFTTVSSVMSGRLVRSRFQRHAHQRLAVQVADRLLAGVRGDVVADLVGGHLLELTLAAALLERLVVLFEHGVARTQRLQLLDQLRVRGVGLALIDILDRLVLEVAAVRSEVLQLLPVDDRELLDGVDVLGAQLGALAFGQERRVVERRAGLGLLQLRLELGI